MRIQRSHPVKQRAGGGPAVTKGTIKTAKRLLNYVFSSYKIQFIVVLVCILMSSVASISVSLSLKFLLDDFIIPLIGQQNPDYTELYTALTILGTIFLCGVISTFIYSRMMVVIGQGVLKRVRDEMFAHMQTLPIRYFDQNTNGSIMSLYTNDTDTLRQMINQSIPQVLMSAFTIIVTFYLHAGAEPDPDGDGRADDRRHDPRVESRYRQQREVFHSGSRWTWRTSPGSWKSG